MGVYEGRGLLSKSMKNLQARWAEAQLGWNDEAAAHFEKKYLEPLQSDFKSAMSAMDHVAVTLVQVRRDCE